MFNSIRIDHDVPMKARDGTILRADIYRPDDEQKHPAILNRTPYGKIIMAERYGFMKMVDAGYAVVFQDLRGRYASEGNYDGGDALLAQERPDGYDTVEWIAEQAWCDGNVGTQGGSYMARVQWLLAMESPPHLKAMAPSISSDTPVPQATLWYGAVSVIMAASSVASMGLDIADRLEEQGGDADRIRQLLNQVVTRPREVLDYLPLKDLPHFDFPGIKDIWYNRGLKGLPPPEQIADIYWDYEKVTVPCLHQSGWYDFNLHGILKNYAGMKKKGGSSIARQGQHLFIGPWPHGWPGVEGEANCPQADTWGAGSAEYTIDFFNRYIKGEGPVPPAVRYFVMGKNVWQTAADWPLPNTSWERYYLHGNGQANTATGDGQLDRSEPGDEPPDTFMYDPHHPVPTRGGAWAAGNGFTAGPLDQSHIEEREDILCYTTPVLEEDLEVTGPLALHLFAATSARDTDFTAKLVDVHPDGHSYNVAEGIIRARFRKSTFAPEFVSPGEIIEYVIDLVATSNLFLRGHRIRIDVSSSNFPALDRNMNTGNPTGEDARGITARQSIFHRAGQASFIDLPVIRE
jgi:putative CocE/NonD family hydrolase